jgi:hypothetical protein
LIIYYNSRNTVPNLNNTSAPSSPSGTIGQSFLKLWNSTEELYSEPFEDNNALWKSVKVSGELNLTIIITQKLSASDQKAGKDVSYSI